MTTELKSMVSWFKTLMAPQIESESHSALDFDPAWHGDHWQNLLSSPMDARRYVMEDWTIPTANTFDTTSSTAEAVAEDAVEAV